MQEIAAKQLTTPKKLIYAKRTTEKGEIATDKLNIEITRNWLKFLVRIRDSKFSKSLRKEDGDVPGWVLVVLMTTGLVTAIWTIAAPKLSSILRNSLDSMNGIR